MRLDSTRHIVKPFELNYSVSATTYIYFGSQSGTAEAFAIQFGDEATVEGIPNKVCDLADFEPEVFREHKLVVLILATTGEGDATDNAIKFDKFINLKTTPKDTFSGVNYCIFGLGDLNYIQFNGMARRTDAAMQRVGANKILERGIGDDSQDIEEDFRKWIDTSGVFEKLKKIAKELHSTVIDGLGKKAGEEEPRRIEHGRITKECPKSDRMSIDGDDTLSKAIFKCCKAKVLSVSKMGSRAVHVDISMPEDMSYDTADTIEILPANSKADVDYFVKAFGIEDKIDYWIDFESTDGRFPFPVPATVRDVLFYYLDLRSPPTRQMITSLAHFDPALREVVGLHKQMHSSEVHLSLVEFFDLFKVDVSALDLVDFAKICAKQKLRSFTGASSGGSGSIGICCSLLSAALPAKLPPKFIRSCQLTLLDRELGRITPRSDSYFGMASTYLCESIKAGDEIRLLTRPSTFKLPKPLPLGPIVMVATGAGIAPFRAMLPELQRAVNPRIHLVYGCRTREDILYSAEVEAAKDSITLHLALSRELETDKTYVQDILRSSEVVKKAIADGLADSNTAGIVMVCGQTNMCKDVLAAVREIVGNVSIEKLQKEHRIVVEFFG
ncbi:hypothetical protein FOL47_005686 [Perkinsus chesapeaki]|uniref:NADPH--hemoprotein reductase n=1 Tax=Perkinsus chesapeaki TaxID=330153 RepID=A0A7J6LWD7_PERCH|nr:hypothetical protein FOL47_005686 [Perkinsus chesapeaki]